MSTLVRTSAGDITEKTVYEEIDDDGNIQFARKRLDEEEPTIVNQMQAGTVLITPLQPCPWVLPPAPITYESLEVLWQEIRQFIYEHLDLENNVLYDVIVAWILVTWTPERWQSAPYLHFIGPSNSGKTRGLDILSNLCYRPLLSPSVTASSIFRALDHYHPTFLLDEFEIYEQMKELKSEIIGVINAGYKRGQVVLRTDKMKDGAPILKAFYVFGPKAIGSIEELPITLYGRSIRIPMSRAVRKVKRLIDLVKAKELRGKLLYYRFKNVLLPPPEGNPIDLPDGRLIELYLPLCVVAPKELEPKILEYAMTQYRENIELERETMEAMVYATIIDILKTKVTRRIFQQTIRDRINEDQPEKYKLGPKKVGIIIRRLGLKCVRNEEEKLMEVIIDADALERRKQRYVLPENYEVIDKIIMELRKPVDTTLF